MGGLDRCPAQECCRAAVSRLPYCAAVVSIPWQLLWRHGRRHAAPERQNPYQQATCVCVQPGRFGVYFDIEALAKGVTIESIETGCSRFLFPHTMCACIDPYNGTQASLRMGRLSKPSPDMYMKLCACFRAVCELSRSKRSIIFKLGNEKISSRTPTCTLSLCLSLSLSLSVRIAYADSQGLGCVCACARFLSVCVCISLSVCVCMRTL